MTEFIIREAVDSDIAGVMVLYVAAGLDSADGFTAEEAQAHLADFRRYPSYRLFVAVLENLEEQSEERVVGTYALLIMDNLAKRGRKLGVAEEVGVLPSYQRKGVGGAMMRHAMAECKAAGCYKLMLSSNLAREEAHRFYESIGFVRHGVSFLVEMQTKVL